MLATRGMSSVSMARGLSGLGALERSPLFLGLGGEEVAAVAAKMIPRAFEPGAAVCEAGTPATRLLVILNGLVHVLGPTSGGEAPRLVARYRRGDVVGAVSLATGEPQQTTAVAGMPTEALELARGDFESLARAHPQLVANVGRILARRLSEQRQRRQRAPRRGEAVALIVSAPLREALPDLLAQACAASPGSVAHLDTRDGFDAAVVALDDLLEEHRTVIVSARLEGRSAPLLLGHVDRCVVLTDDPEAPGRLEPASRDALATRAVEVVLVGEGPEPRLGNGLRLLRVARRDRRFGTHGIPPEDLAWLGRHLTATKLGLALGAGGAKGFAHVGALQVLEEAGYVVDAVAGSSIGAVVGALLALGMDAAQVDRTLRETFSPSLVAEVFQLSLAGTSTGRETLARAFREATGERTFDDLRIALTIMAVDLDARAPAPLRDGPLWQALLAATALAGMFPPSERQGHRLVDGLALVPVPTAAATEAGADVVLSVNLMARETLPAWPGAEPATPAVARSGSRTLDTLLEVMDLMQLDTATRAAQLADVALSPRFGPGSWRDFHLADLFLEAGREAARAQLAELAELARPQVQLPGRR